MVKLSYCPTGIRAGRDDGETPVNFNSSNSSSDISIFIRQPVKPTAFRRVSHGEGLTVLWGGALASGTWT